jgi:hypothetical protein
MCLEYCFDCQVPCWPRDDLLSVVSPQPAGISQADPNHTDVERPVDVQPVGLLLQGQHEKQARHETDMATLPGEMPGSSPQYEKRWYTITD